MGAMYALVRPLGLFLDYADADVTNATQNGTFEDASSTAMMAATVYQSSLVDGVDHWLPNAERARGALSSTNSSSSSSSSSSNGNRQPASALDNMAHFMARGVLTPVVDPDNFTVQGAASPEGQAFVLEMQGAWGGVGEGGE